MAEIQGTLFPITQQACSTCGEIKEMSSFSRRGDGFRKKCRACQSKTQRQRRRDNRDMLLPLQRKYRKEYYRRRHDYLLSYYREKNRKRRKEHPEKIRLEQKLWRQKNAAKIKARRKELRTKRRDEINAQHRPASRRYYQKLKTDKERHAKKREVFNKWRRMWMSIPSNRIAHNLRVRLRGAMKAYGEGKWMRASSYGIDIRALVNALGLPPGKLSEWHIDHIVPCVAFDHANRKELLACWHISNLRWMPGKSNQSKGNKYSEQDRQALLNLVVE